MKDPYLTLGIPPDASDAEIKRAYRTKAQKTHPDRDDGSKEEFQEVVGAYKLLSDRRRREHYDKTGEKLQTENDTLLVIEMCAMLLSQLVDGCDDPSKLDRVDFFEKARASVHHKIAEYKEKTRVLEVGIAKRQRVLNRTIRKSHNGIQEDVVVAVLRSGIEDLKVGIEKLNGDVAIQERVLEVLNDYRYNVLTFENELAVRTAADRFTFSTSRTTR